MATRFTDDLVNNTDSNDFIVRRRVPVATQIALIFAVAFVLIYVSACLMSASGSQKIFSITLMASIGTLSWFTIFSFSRLRDLVMATEFQNAMLASAAQLSTRFCLITKRDGTIVYVDPGFQKVFPQFMQTNDRNIDGLFSASGISAESITKIILLLQHNQSDRVLLPLRNADGGIMPIMLSVDVLPRPKGYFLMRGRDYVEKRETEATNSTLSLASEMGLAQALDVLPEGILITSSTGVITYMNQVLEHWLGFAPGEVLTQPFKIGQVIYQYGGNDAGRLIGDNFDGDVVLQRKDRSLINMRIRQAAFGKPPALCAIISIPDTVKKK